MMLIEEVTEENIKGLTDGEVRYLALRCGWIWQKIEGGKHEENKKA